jgi:hypothetical protein
MRKPVRHTRKRYKGGGNNNEKESKLMMRQIKQLQDDIQREEDEIYKMNEKIDNYTGAIEKVYNIKEKCGNDDSLECLKKYNIRIDSPFIKSISEFIQSMKETRNNVQGRLDESKIKVENKKQRLEEILLKRLPNNGDKFLLRRKNHIRFNHGGRRSHKYRK